MPTYEVLAGRHSTGRGRNRVVAKKGDLVTTHIDLEKRFNVPGFPAKYRKVEGVAPSQKLGKIEPQPVNTLPPPQTHGMETLDSMTIEELRKYAAEEEIDLGQAKTKGQILDAIKASVS